jgi:hypothetical protein
VPRPMPCNRVWGCDLLVQTDRHSPFSIMRAGPVYGCSNCQTSRRGHCYRN